MWKLGQGRDGLGGGLDWSLLLGLMVGLISEGWDGKGLSLLGVVEIRFRAAIEDEVQDFYVLYEVSARKWS